ncbi:MAG: FMN-binding protein [Clostridia bacterium]|nr:FMN-binding protein [Clostridia bacterium]
MKNTPVAMISVLAIICLAVSALLGFVNFLTEDTIAEIAEAKVQAAMADIIPNATFEQVDATAYPAVTKMYKATSTSGENAGVCVQLSSSGFAADIVLIVGINADKTIAGVRITSINETAGLGSKANDPAWLSQFEGLTGTLNLVKNSKTADNDVVAISGATVTSTAVTKGVQTALDAAADYLGGGK